MWKLSLLLLLAALSYGQKQKNEMPAPPKKRLEIGRIVTERDTVGKDTFVTPEGKGLPAGRGTAFAGKQLYEKRCSRCHGSRGEGADDQALAGGIGSLATAKELRTVGSFWPHAPGVWDYVNRSMPFNQPGALGADQVYSVVAYILYLNKLIDEKDEMNPTTLPQVKMPNRDGFVKDSRPDVTSK